jgi:hypothetical protein
MTLGVVMSSVTIPIVAAPILTTQNLLEMVTQMEVVGTKTEVLLFFVEAKNILIKKRI